MEVGSWKFSHKVVILTKEESHNKMKKTKYSFIIISTLIFLILNFYFQNTIHKFIVILSKLSNLFVSFSSSSIDILLVSTIPFLSYLLIRNNFYMITYFKNIFYFFIITSISLLIFINISPVFFKFENPLIPEYIIFIKFKYYFTIAIFLGILTTYLIIKFLIKNNKLTN